jgi:hypothetical protein
MLLGHSRADHAQQWRGWREDPELENRTIIRRMSLICRKALRGGNRNGSGRHAASTCICIANRRIRRRSRRFFLPPGWPQSCQLPRNICVHPRASASYLRRNFLCCRCHEQSGGTVKRSGLAAEKGATQIRGRCTRMSRTDPIFQGSFMLLKAGRFCHRVSHLVAASGHAACVCGEPFFSRETPISSAVPERLAPQASLLARTSSPLPLWAWTVKRTKVGAWGEQTSAIWVGRQDGGYA